jgi:hypothetical protein
MRRPNIEDLILIGFPVAVFVALALLMFFAMRW